MKLHLENEELDLQLACYDLGLRVVAEQLKQ
jgi:hypothetical protein